MFTAGRNDSIRFYSFYMSLSTITPCLNLTSYFRTNEIMYNMLFIVKGQFSEVKTILAKK